MARFASIYPLVTTRSLAQPFTYVGEGLERGMVVAMPFGGVRRRGVVVDTSSHAPSDVDLLEVDRVVGKVLPSLVDLALWMAEYYASTPGRTLALVAPLERRRRKTAPRYAGASGFEPEAVPGALTAPQKEALARIVAELDTGSGHRFLLHGATGSGKTEVYLRACEAALARGLGAIVLVPEIALTPQALSRFRGRFGDTVSCLHSGLSSAERRDERERIAEGEARVVIGARSAIFAPLRGLGLVCIDEEQDASYKQESEPRYDARTVAARRAQLEGALVVHGSATPRPESWELLERLTLGPRLKRRLPPVRVVDLRRESGYPLSAPLLAELGSLGDRGGKAILLLNRRGIAPALHCRACGHTVRCVRCDVALVLHGDRRLHCHHCGFALPAGPLCPACGSAEVARLGAGTERLEHELAERLPELTVIRLDADTTASRGAHEEILGRFATTDRAVLLGTQMVAKGHHFPDVSLAAVVDADAGMLVPDFRAEERTFQLLTQLAGRSGRDGPGRVLVQTFSPDARPIELASRHGVAEFLAGELERRRALDYPPFCHLIRTVVSGPSGDAPLALLRELRAGLEHVAVGAQVLGPAPLLRLRGRHRAQLLVKIRDPRPVSARIGRLLEVAAKPMRRDGLTVMVDVDPQSFVS